MDTTRIFTEYFLLRLLINTSSMIILVRIVYYHTYQRKDSFFTFFLLNLIVFLLAYMLEKTISFSIGSAFGLLAAFSLLRLRTESISLKDMTYVFITMTFGLLNSILKGSYLEIIALNIMIIVAVYIVDGNLLMRNQKIKTIDYGTLDNIKPERRTELIADLKDRTGLDIVKITIEHIDFIKDRAVIKIYYY